MLYALPLICRFKSQAPHPMPLVKAWLYSYRISGLSSARERPQDFFNTELLKTCPFISELKLWAFWAFIFINFDGKIEGNLIKMNDGAILEKKQSQQ
jgi:hypothetical protein